MSLATVTTKGQITIPKVVRQSLGISIGDRVEFVEVARGRYEIVAATREITELEGIVGNAKRVVSIDEINDAILKMGRYSRTAS